MITPLFHQALSVAASTLAQAGEAAAETAATAVEQAAPLATEVPSVAAVMALAVVQGLTEFLPVSSSGHLALGRAVMDVQAGGLALDVALHVGTLLAIVWAFRKDVGRLFTDLFAGRFQTWIWLVIATLPVAVIGIAFKDSIEAASGTVMAAGCGLFVTATALMVGETARKRAEREGGAAPEADLDQPLPKLRMMDAVVMGCAQAVAIWPGVSRSGSTISAGLVRGLPAAEAARLSFLMSLPAISGAAVVELPHALEEGFGGLSPWVVLGAAGVAGLVGWAALKTLMLVLRKGSFPYFAAYCALLGTAALVLGR